MTPQRSRPITIVCDWLPPDFGAVGQYMVNYARDQARLGRDVLLIGLTRQQGGNQVEAHGTGSVTIRRLIAPASPKANLFQRGLWALTTNLRLLREVHRARSSFSGGDLIVTGSPPFLSSMLLVLNSLVWRQSLTYRITDFYPETVIAAGKAPWLKLIQPLVSRLRRLAATIEVLGEDQRRRLREDGFPDERIVLRRDRSPIAIDKAAEPFVNPFEPWTKILLYSGNLGVAHPPGVFLEAYRRHIQEGRNDVRLWMNGQGARIAELQAFCELNALPLHLTPSVPLEDLPRLLNTAHAHLILLGSGYWGYVLPSKIYGCLESGKPVLFVGPKQSDVHLLIQASGDFRHVSTETVDECFDFLESLERTSNFP